MFQKAREGEKIIQIDRCVVLDLETTGLDPAEDRIIEVYAAGLNEDFTVDKEYYSLIDPKRPLPERIVELTGITETQIEKKGKPEKKVLLELKNFLNGKILVGHNMDGFDLPFLKYSFFRNGLDIHNETFDTLTRARTVFNFDSYALEALSLNLGISSERFHNARNDVLVTIELFRKLMNAGTFDL